MAAETNRESLIALSGGVIGAVLIAVYYHLVWPTTPAFVDSLDHCGSLFCDFVNHYYRMGRQVFVSPYPVDGFFYSAFFALLLRPFGAALLPTALWYWGVLQIVGSIALLAVPVRRLLRLSPLAIAVYAVVFLTSIPLLHNFKWGQVSVIVTLAVVAAFWAGERGHERSAGVLLAFAAAVKYYPAVFLIHYLVRRKWRVAGWFIAAAFCFLVVIPVVVLGLEWTYEFQKESAAMVAVDAEYVARNANSQYVAHVVQRLTGVPRDSWWVSLFAVAGLAIAAVNMALVWLRRRSGGVRIAALSMALIFVSLPFVTTTSWPHYFVYLPICQAAVAAEAASRTGWKWRPWVLGAALVSAALSSVFVFNLYPDWKTYLTVPFIFASNGLLLLCLYGLLGSAGDSDDDHR